MIISGLFRSGRLDHVRGDLEHLLAVPLLQQPRCGGIEFEPLDGHPPKDSQDFSKEGKKRLSGGQ